jgi:hypothetical protein
MQQVSVPRPIPREAIPPSIAGLEMENAQLRAQTSELESRIIRLRHEQARLAPGEQHTLDGPLSEAQRDLLSARNDLAAHDAEIAGLRAQYERSAIVQVQPQPAGTMGRSFPGDWFSDGLGLFILLLPLVLAASRFVWMRGGTKRSTLDPDSSPRLERLEQTMDSIAVEVERIGEAQRFVAKLLAERARNEPVESVGAPQLPARRPPGVITPH